MPARTPHSTAQGMVSLKVSFPFSVKKYRASRIRKTPNRMDSRSRSSRAAIWMQAVLAARQESTGTTSRLREMHLRKWKVRE